MGTLIPISGMLFVILINIIVFGAIIMVVRSIVQAKNKERMALIEKGVDLSEFYAGKKSENNTLKYGMLLVGIGVGLLIGFLLTKYISLPPVAVVISITLIFGGASLLMYYWLDNKKKNNQLP